MSECEICGGSGFVPMLDVWQMQKDYDPVVGLAAYDSVQVMPMLHDCPCGECRPDDHVEWCERLYAERGSPFASEE